MTLVFKNSYEESRLAFLELANSSGGELTHHELPGDLAFESLYLPPSSGRKDRLLILTSGIHGIEGFTGSALQRYFMEKNYFGSKDENLGILVVHGINAYGFKHKLRGTENNVDLNRNFETSRDLFKTVNPGYGKVYRFLNPKKKISRLTYLAEAAYNIARYGLDNLRQAILKGQYSFPEGLFYGGSDFEPHVALIENEIRKVGEGYEKVLLIDIHTGYGRRGKLHVWGNISESIDESLMSDVFRDEKIVYEKDFYGVTGCFNLFVAKLFDEKAKFAGACFEFGTIDSQSLKGSLESMYRMINEKFNEELFTEMFYPSSKKWRKDVLEQFEKTLTASLRNFKNLPDV